ncbi:hypothetical protein ACIO8G_32735 [Streptomyces sp. NPDC087219]|uniref:hypothetical protein n=1 Tax=unclassified Streptomyces TaxID=2593676 RepID=UPI0037F22B03
MFDETLAPDTDTGAPRRSAPGQLRLQLPHQSAPVHRERHVEGSGAGDGGAAASGLFNIIGNLADGILPF